MLLKDIFCQDKAISVLQHAYSNGKSAHAYIFAGPEGIGKFTTASAWAKMLLCLNPVSGKNFADSCGECKSCRLFDSQSHPDFIHVYKELLEFTENGKNRTVPIEFPIDVIREFLIAKASQKPSLSNRKVFVLSETEKLNNHAQNAMLKVLEEPPDYCSIILLCCEPDKLLATIKSRSQIVRFGLIDETIVIEKLRAMGLDNNPARYLARLAQGSLGQAKSWAELELEGAGLYKTKTEIVRVLADYQYSRSLEIADNFLQKAKSLADLWSKKQENTSKSDINRRALKTVLRIIVLALNDTAKLPFTEPEKLVNFDQLAEIKKLSAKFDPEQAAQKVTDCCENVHWIDSNANEKLVFEQLLLNLPDSDTIKV
ncbi:MAG: DNA polymerase III subunit delta' C-terminal domain-containing protein [Phycisphaerae bacterium]